MPAGEAGKADEVAPQVDDYPMWKDPAACPAASRTPASERPGVVTARSVSYGRMTGAAATQ